MKKLDTSDTAPENRSKDSLDETRNALNTSINAFSRVLAVMLLMIVPGVVGYYLDHWLGTRFLIVIGFIVGMILAIFGLILVVKRADDEMKQRP